MHLSSVISRDSIYHSLRECIKQKDLRSGHLAYSLIIRIGSDSIIIFSDLLIRLFAICGKLHESNYVFHKVPKPTVHTWNAIISAHAIDGKSSEKAFQLYFKMKENGIMPNRYVFLSVARLCAISMNLEYGRLVHEDVRKAELLDDVHVANSLIDMYVKCMSLEESRFIFNELVCRDLISWSIMISGYANSGQISLALQLFVDMQQEGKMPNNVIFVCIIKLCPSVDMVKLIHSQIVEGGFEPDIVITNVLIDIYAKFQHISDAHKVFDCCIDRDIVSWGAMIASYVHQEQGDYSIQLFYSLQQQGLKPSNVIFSSVLKACAILRCLRVGRWIHSQALSCGYKSDIVIGNTLIDMYAKCHSAQEAKVVFDALETRDDVSWGGMFSVYTEEQNGVACFDLLKKMQQAGTRPSIVVYLSLLKACITLQDITVGRDMHAQIVMGGFHGDNVIGCTLIDMYAKCGSLNEARTVFDSLSSQDSAAWCALIVGYAQDGYFCQVLNLFQKLQKTNLKPDASLFLSVVKACDSKETIDYGRLLHRQIIYWGYELETQLVNALINMYGNVGDVHDASKVFEKLSERNDLSWVSMMAVYVDHGYAALGLKHCANMSQEGIKFDRVMFIYVVKAQGILGNLKEGQWLHHEIVMNKMESDVIIASSLIDMYAKCRCMDDASEVFTMIPNQNAVSYGAMISGFVRCGMPFHALDLFDCMENDIEPSEATYVCCLKACGIINALDRGRGLHKQLFMNEHMNLIIGSALIDMYAKCGQTDDACRVFDEMPERSIVMWGLMISMYTDNGCGHRALELFDIMRQDHRLIRRKPTFLSVLKACSDVGALRNARMIHDELIRREMDQEIVLANAVIDCYSRCGSMKEAQHVFDWVCEHDLVSWTALIVGYAHCGNTIMMRQCLENMQQQEDMKLDELIFMNILVACRHSGLIMEACLYFRSMSETHGITPSVDHYNCMIDILSRGGYIQEAEHLLQTMHLAPDLVGWRSLLTCCTNYENTDMSLQCFTEVSQRDPENGSAYALMSNVYMNNHIGGVESPHMENPRPHSDSKDAWVGNANTFCIRETDLNIIQKTIKGEQNFYIFFLLLSSTFTMCGAILLHFKAQYLSHY